MELHLAFQQGQMTGEGRDYVGQFIVRGQYSLGDGRCHWIKRYVGKHDVFYQGYNEGKGIWGIWEIPDTQHYNSQRGGFHIWPEGMADPTQPHLAEAAEIPTPVAEPMESAEPVAEPVGAGAAKLVEKRNAAPSADRTGNRGKRQRLPAVSAHSPMANLPGMIAQFPFASRTAEVIDRFHGGPP